MVFQVHYHLSRATIALALVAAAATAYVTFGLPFSKLPRTGSTGKIQRKKVSKRNCIRGLYNDGNTCFLNTTLQALAACPSFLRWIQNLNVTQNSNCPTIRALSSVLSCINREDNEFDDSQNVCSARDLAKALCDKGWKLLSQEEDAHEFLNILSTSVAEELIKFSGSSGLALVSENSGNGEAVTKSPFHGYLGSQLCCLTCGHKIPVHYDAFECLSIPLPNVTEFQNVFSGFSLNGLLEKFLQPETVTDVDCSNCAQNRDPVKRAFSRKHTLAKLPKCLCVHVQRTQWLCTGQLIKRHDVVAFSTTFDASRFFCSGKPHQLPTNKCQYQLQAAVVHMGTVDSGHFVTYRRGPWHFSHVWLCVSDADIRIVDLNEVLRSCPYMLFYERA